MKINKRFAFTLFGLLLSLGVIPPAFGQDASELGKPDAPRFTLPKREVDDGIHSDHALPSVSIMPRGGSFGGGGGRSFGGGGGGFGGGGRSFGGSSTGSFGGGGRSFGGSTSSPRSSNSSGTSSFGRSGGMGSSGPTRSSSVYGTRSSSTYSYGGHTGYYYGGGYSYGWMHPVWYMYTPFYPSFYYGPPMWNAGGGYWEPGGFSLTRLLEGLCCCPLVFIGIIWLLAKSFGGGKRIKYTSVN